MESSVDRYLYKLFLLLDPKEMLDHLDQQEQKDHKDLLENVVMME